MHRLILLFTFNLCLGLNFNPDGIDYCNIKCYPDNITSSGCDCNKVLRGRTLKNENLTQFRKLVVDIHNELRNKVARGAEENFPPAANMRVMNYDLELEYLAQCFILSRFDNDYDPCPATSYCGNSPTGQTVIGNPTERDNSDKIFMMDWYSDKKEIPKKKIPCLLRSFYTGSWKAFTRMIWAEMDRVGCARGRLPANPNKQFRYILVCNYATFCLPCGCGSEMYEEWPVYQMGPKCSNCGDLKCNNKLGGPYDALCGEEKEIGSDLGGDKNCTRFIITGREYGASKKACRYGG